MRIWTLALIVLIFGLIMGIVRDEIGRVAVIVFFTGLSMSMAGVASIMALFQTVGALGEARDLGAHVEAIAATVLVLTVAAFAMLGLLFVGGLLLQWAIP
jgi:hypothetical protein